MDKQRKSLDKLKFYFSKERIVILLGSRQVGKTTLMRMIKPHLEREDFKIHYFNLETPSELQQLNIGVAGLKQEGFLNETEKICLMIDEFHYLQEPNRLFKEIYDTLPNVKLLASGSSSLEIQQKIRESLAGRKWTLHVYPLDFQEFLQFVDSEHADFFDTLDPEGTTQWSKHAMIIRCQSHFSNFVLFGGLPKVVLESNSEAKKINLEEIFTSYIQKDIKGILKNIEIVPFNQLVLLINAQIGNLLNVAELSNTLQMKRNQVVHHLEILQQTFVNFLLKPYFTNKRKEVAKTPKTFFYDNGIRNQILKHFAPLSLRADGGALLENAIYMELKKNIPVSQEIYYWRTKNQTEVDFIIRRDDGNFFPIEVKMGDEKTIPAALRSFSETHAVKRAFILNATQWFSKKEGETTYYFIPHFLACKIPHWITA